MRVLPLLMALFLTACTSPKTDTGVVKLGMETDVSSLDPRFATDAISTNICRLLYAGLMRRDARMTLQPWLADSVEQKDPVTYLINLKKNARFHDGRPLTSADVKFTFNSILDPKTGSPLKNSLGEVASMETPDAFTVAVKLKEPYAPFIGNLTFGIVPEGSGTDLGEKPVGAGPFRFESRKRGEKLTLSRNALYFGEIPKIPRLVFRVVPDETVRVLELKKGDLHILPGPLMPAVLPWLAKQNSMSVESMPGSNVSYIGFNMRDRYLKDVRVRRAIAQAIDRDAIIRYFLLGTAEKTDTMIAGINPFHADSLPSWGYDPENAKRLLDDAGFRDPGGGKPRFTLSFKTSKNASRKKLAEIFGQYLAKVGIGLEIKSFEWGTFFADIRSGNFQLYSLTWVGVADPDILRFIFHSKNIPPDGFNRGRYENPALDILLDEGKAEQDQAKRKGIYGQIQKTLADDLPFFNLWVSNNIAAIDRRVMGFVIYPDEGLDSLATASIGEM